MCTTRRRHVHPSNRLEAPAVHVSSFVSVFVSISTSTSIHMYIDRFQFQANHHILLYRKQTPPRSTQTKPACTSPSSYCCQVSLALKKKLSPLRKKTKHKMTNEKRAKKKSKQNATHKKHTVLHCEKNTVGWLLHVSADETKYFTLQVRSERACLRTLACGARCFQGKTTKEIPQENKTTNQSKLNTFKRERTRTNERPTDLNAHTQHNDKETTRNPNEGKTRVKRGNVPGSDQISEELEIDGHDLGRDVLVVSAVLDVKRSTLCV